MIFLLQKTLVYAVPLLIVALAGVFAERSGIINIALDGMMIFGSFCGAVFVYFCQSAGAFRGMPQILFLLALLVSGVAGALYSLLLSFASIKLKADQTIGGTALNLLAPAITLLLVKVFLQQDKLVMPKDLDYVILNDNLPGILRVFFDKAYLSTYLIIILFAILSIFLYKTKTGLRLRACGEHPQAADSVGINVYKMRYLGTTISGALAGIGGYAYIATAAGGTAQGTVAGMGFLALAIMIFGNWKPIGIALASLLFGFLKCIAPIYAILDLNGDGVYFLKELGLPMYFYNMLPYVAVLVVLAFTSKKSRAPKAEGIPYDKGQR